MTKGTAEVANLFNVEPDLAANYGTEVYPGYPGLVLAEAWVVQGGRRTAFVEGTLKDTAGTLLAKASSTITMASRAKVEAAARAALGK